MLGARASARVARGFSAPPLAAAFLPETEWTAPNPALKAERATEYSVGVQARPCGAFETGVELFRTRVKDAIQSVTNDKGQTVAENVGHQRRQGVEVSGALRLAGPLSLAGGVTYNRVRAGTEEAVVDGTARQTRDLTVRYGSDSSMTRLWVGGHWVAYDLGPDLTGPPLGFTARDRRFIWSAKGTRRHPVWHGAGVVSLDLSVENVLDTSSWWLTPYPLPGRAVYVGVGFGAGR